MMACPFLGSIESRAGRHVSRCFEPCFAGGDDDHGKDGFAKLHQVSASEAPSSVNTVYLKGGPHPLAQKCLSGNGCPLKGPVCPSARTGLHEC